MAEDATNVYTGTTNFDKTLQTLIRLRLEEQLRNPLPLVQAGNLIPATMVKGSNGTMRFLAIGDLPVDVSDGSGLWVITEGEPNDSEDLDFGYEEFTVRQGMRTVKITDVAALESPIDLISTAAEKVSRVLMEIENAIVAKALAAGTNTVTVDGGASTALDSSDVLTGAFVRQSVAELEATNVPTFGDQSYRGYIHPYVKLDLSGDEDAGGWIDIAKYATPGSFLTGEIGKYGGVRFIKSIVGAKVADAGSASFDVFNTYIVGPDFGAFGDFGNTQTFFTPPGGHDDPGHQSALVTCKGWWGAFLLGEGSSATGPVSAPRYITLQTGASKDTDA